MPSFKAIHDHENNSVPVLSHVLIYPNDRYVQEIGAVREERAG